MRSNEFLQAAIDVQNQRAAEYDQPGGERSIASTVLAFNAITGRELTEAEGWLFLQVLKDVRQWSATGYHHDSALDGVAYSALKAEALHGEQDTDTPQPIPSDRLRLPPPFASTWMGGDTVRGKSGAEYIFDGVDECGDARLRNSGSVPFANLTWISRPEAPPVPHAPGPELWQKGDVLRFVAQSGNYFTPGNEYSVAVVGQTRIFIVDDSSREHPVTAEFARSNFKWMSRP